jgi:hypothetical protein
MDLSALTVLTMLDFLSPGLFTQASVSMSINRKKFQGVLECLKKLY